MEMNQKMFTAAATGDISVAERCFAENRDILSRTSSRSQDTALHIALRNGHLRFARWMRTRCERQLLLQPNAKGDTPMHCALQGGVPDFVLDCERDGYLTNAVDPRDRLVNNAGNSIMYLAAESGQRKVVKRLLYSRFGDDISGPRGSTALHAACGFPGILDELLSRHPILKHRQDANGNTALHYATMANNWRACFRLTEGDAAGLLIRNNDGLLPLHLAAIHHRTTIFVFFLCLSPESVWEVTPNGKNVLHLSVEYESLDIIEYLAWMQPRYNELMYMADAEENTPLHLAATEGNQILLRLTELAKVSLSSIRNRVDVDLFGAVRNRVDVDLFGAVAKTRAKINAESRRMLAEAWSKTANALLVVAALIIQATYSLVFQIPGGYKEGDATSQAFVISNAFAFACSLAAATFLIVHDRLKGVPVQVTRQLAWMAIFMSMVSMVLAFTVGTSMVTGTRNMLVTKSIESLLGLALVGWFVTLIVVLLCLTVLLFSRRPSAKAGVFLLRLRQFEMLVHHKVRISF